MKIRDLSIGEVIFTYSDKILEHQVVEKQILETDKHKEVFWILECQSCTDHTKCRFAIKRDEQGDLMYSHMINNYECDDEDESECRRNTQYFWHKDARFFKNRNEARLYVWDRNISYYQSKIEEAKKTIEYNEKCIEEAKEKKQGIIDANDTIKTLQDNK